MKGLAQTLGLQEPCLVAIAGSGGKTTLLYQLAVELALASPVVVSTTTHIYPPRAGQADGPWLLAGTMPSPQQLQDRLRPGRPLALAQGLLSNGKLEGLRDDQLAALGRQPGLWLLVEADGAARRPLKAWARHEPALPSMARVVVVVAGAAGLGRPLGPEWVHRPELFAQASGLALGQAITAQGLARVLCGSEGPRGRLPQGARALLVINQTDAASPRLLGELDQALQESGHGYEAVYWGQLLKSRLEERAR